jgi:hypothetical protein
MFLAKTRRRQGNVPRQDAKQMFLAKTQSKCFSPSREDAKEIEFLYFENQVVELNYFVVHQLLIASKLRSLPTGEGQGGAKKS